MNCEIDILNVVLSILISKWAHASKILCEFTEISKSKKFKILINSRISTESNYEYSIYLFNL